MKEQKGQELSLLPLKPVFEALANGANNELIAYFTSVIILQPADSW